MASYERLQEYRSKTCFNFTRLECVRGQLPDLPLDPLPEVGDVGAAADEDDVPAEPALRLLGALADHVHDGLRDASLQSPSNDFQNIY